MGKTILIVEDDHKNLKLFRDLLQKLGYSIVEATDGNQAVKLAQAEKPSLILMDIQLPVMDGLEATRAIKSNASTKNIPIIALTAYVMKTDEDAAIQAGCDGYLSKPIKVHMLLEKVEKYLRK